MGSKIKTLTRKQKETDKKVDVIDRVTINLFQKVRFL